jgi:hypothetical protein
MTLPPVTQTDTMNKAGLTPANESTNQTQERTALNPFISLTYMDT